MAGNSGSSIRGSRVGAGPMGEDERGEPAPRVAISFWCANQHESKPTFAVGVEPPEQWDCPRCGFPAGRDEANPPEPPKNMPYKSHLAYVKERRSNRDGGSLLREALKKHREAEEEI